MARVLLVDDDPTLRSVLADSLREDGYAVQVFAAPGEVPALDTLSAIDLVITDYEMPGESGLAFADRFHAVYPAVPVVLMSAHCASTFAGAVTARHFLHLWGKPFVYDELNALLHQLAADAANGHRAVHQP